MTVEKAREVIALIAQHRGNVTAAARASGIARPTLQSQEQAALLTLKRAEAPVVPTPIAEADSLRDRVFELEAQLKSVASKTLTDEYVQRKVIGLTTDVANVRAPTWAVELPRGETLPGVPITLWSDWHWGERVFPAQVNGVNEFNMEIAHQRARRLLERVVYLLRKHVVNPDYPGIVLNLGGDMMSGDIHEELSNTNEKPVMVCLLDLYAVLRWAISSLADEFGHVFIPCVTGNHGRNTKKPRAKDRNFTNFDWLLYQFLAKSFEGDARVQFFIPEGPDALYSVVGHKYLLTHGDQFRGGDGIIGAIGPITRGASRKQSRNSAINRGFDTMLLGHWHQYMPLHRTLVNGSLKGYDEYANVSNFGYEPPIQALWLTHPEHGVTMHMPVYLEQHAGRAPSSEWITWKE